MKEAAVKSLPIMFSYIFVSMAYGILMESAGLHWYYSLFVSMTVYTGAFQFVFVTLAGSGATFITIALTAFLMNSRQSFYSLTFVDEFNDIGRKNGLKGKLKKLYMIQTMTDETYAVNCVIQNENGKSRDEKQKTMFGVAFLSRLYWMAGAVIGGVLGQIIPFDMTGIDFCMTALFVVIFLDQWESARSHVPALVGIVTSILCLFIVGINYFLLPALIISSGILLVWNAKRQLE